jgi:CBS domain-containing protein
MMKIKDVMTSRVITVEPEAKIHTAIRLMLQNRISGLPIVNKNGVLVGMVTEGDFLRRAETGTERRRPRWLEFLIGPGQLADDYTRAHARTVEEVMTSDVHSVGEDAPLQDAVQLMERHQVKRLPVLRQGKLVGLVTRANLLHALASRIHDAKTPTAGDQEIRSALTRHLQQQSWAPAAAVDITVTDSVVELWGTVTDERTRRALVVAAENTAGVKEVRDHLAWIDVSSGLVLSQPAEPARAKTS